VIQARYVLVIEETSRPTSENTVSVTHRKLASSATSCDNCGVQDSDKRNTLYVWIK
jgi:hypothetical protein